MPVKIELSLSTFAETAEWAAGAKILGAFLNEDPQFAPEQLTLWGKAAGDFATLDAVKDIWASPANIRVGGSLVAFKQGLCWNRRTAPRYKAQILHHTGRDTRGRPTAGLFHMSASATNTDWFGLTRRIAAALRVESGALNVCGPDIPRRDTSFALSLPDMAYTGVGALVFLPNARISERQEDQAQQAGIEVSRQDWGAVLALMPSAMAAAKDGALLGARQETLRNILNDGSFSPPPKPPLPNWYHGR